MASFLETKRHHRFLGVKFLKADNDDLKDDLSYFEYQKFRLLLFFFSRNFY